MRPGNLLRTGLAFFALNGCAHQPAVPAARVEVAAALPLPPEPQPNAGDFATWAKIAQLYDEIYQLKTKAKIAPDQLFDRCQQRHGDSAAQITGEFFERTSGASCAPIPFENPIHCRRRYFLLHTPPQVILDHYVRLRDLYQEMVNCLGDAVRTDGSI